jgi:hypothetical protein
MRGGGPGWCGWAGRTERRGCRQISDLQALAARIHADVDADRLAAAVAAALPAERVYPLPEHQIAERRAANMRRFVADLAAVHPLRLNPDEAADIVWATNAPEMYQLLAD